MFSGCPQLTLVDAHHNNLRTLPDTVDPVTCVVHTLLLHHNRLCALPLAMLAHMNRWARVAHSLCPHTQSRLRILNVAQNFLAYLPPAGDCAVRVQQLILAANCFDDSVWPVLVQCTRLRTLDLSYNRLAIVPDGCACTRCVCTLNCALQGAKSTVWIGTSEFVGQSHLPTRHGHSATVHIVTCT